MYDAIVNYGYECAHVIGDKQIVSYVGFDETRHPGTDM